MQGSLFGHGAPTFDARFRAGQRQDLGFGAWIEHVPGWVNGHETLYVELAALCGWQSERRVMYERVVDVPRLMARGPKDHVFLERTADALSTRYHWSLNRTGLNWYRDGRDSVAYHGDKLGRLIDDCVVAIVSVGAPRRFLMRSVAGGATRVFNLGWGDLLVMGGSCQRTWLHGIPKMAQADPRISIVFRPEVP